MAAPVLNHSYIFGVKSDVSSPIHYIDNTCVLYAAGHNLVLYSFDTKQQRFIQGTDVNGPQGRTEICALAVSPNKRYVAFAERGVDRGMISIYDLRTLKKRKTLISTEMRSREYVSLCFSPDSKCLLSMGGGPDWTIINWLWSKMKPQHIFKIENAAATAQLPITQVSFCAADPNIICISGKQTLLCFALDPTSAKPRHIELSLFGRPLEDYTCHLWLDEAASNRRRMIVGTSSGSLLLFDNFMFRGTLKMTMDETEAVGSRVNASAFSAPRSIEYLVSARDGFIVGCDAGVVKTFRIESDNLDVNGNESYVLSRSFHIENMQSKIKGIDVSPVDDTLVCVTENQQSFILKNFSTDVLKSEDMKFEILNVPYHTGPITGLDTCVRKPIVVTCGVDRTVRVWNYVTKQVELIVNFQETPLCIALHPSGLHLLVGFTDKLRLMNILMDDIRPYKEFQIKNCSEVQFSHGGHMFAAINVGLIQVYNTYTCEQIAIFRGHTLTVKSLYWSLDDTNIVSAGLDGAVYERKLGQTARTQEHVQKGCKFSSALCTEDDKIYAVGDDKMLKEIIDKNVNKTLDAGVILTQLVVSHPPQRMLFAGTINGVIRSFAFPLTGVVKDYQCHSKAVNRLKITQDDGFLFSVSDDGCLAIFNIKEKEGRIAKRDRPDAVPFAEEILVTKSDLEEKNSLMIELKGKVDELTASNEYQLRLHDMNYQEKLKEVSEKYNLQIEHDKARIDHLRDDKQELESEFEERISVLKQQHASQLHSYDLEHQKAIMKRVSEFQKLQHDFEEEEMEIHHLQQDRYAMHQEELEMLKEKYEHALKKAREEMKYESEQKTNVIREFQETREQLSEDVDKEVELLKEKYDLKLASERDSTLRLKGENGIMKKKFSALQSDIAEQQENIKTMVEKEEQLLNHIKILEEKIFAHKNEIKERDKTIGENERQIYDLKKDNQELEKFKFVLDYQIKELKRQIEPRENEIAVMKDQVMKMDIELESYHKENGQYKQQVADLKQKLQEKMNEIRKQRQQYRQAVAELDSLSNDLHETVNYIQDPSQLKEYVKKLYQKHVTEKIHAQEVDPDVNKEYKRQKLYLEKSVEVLKKKLSRDLRARRNDNMRLMQENVALIKEINKLRREIKLMHQVQRQKELNTATRPTQPIEADQWNEKERKKLSDMQRQHIETLRLQIEEAQQRLQNAKSTVGNTSQAPNIRPNSRGLQPMGM